MSNQSPEALLAVIDNGGSSSLDREGAIHQLKEFPTPAVIDRLIRALEDDDSGVRWAAATTLIEFGKAAAAPLLRTLVEKNDSVWLREGAYRVFHDTHDATVQALTADVVKALKGPAAGLMTTEAAVKALGKLG
jgi:HEAT repeat protein